MPASAHDCASFSEGVAQPGRFPQSPKIGEKRSLVQFYFIYFILNFTNPSLATILPVISVPRQA